MTIARRFRRRRQPRHRAGWFGQYRIEGRADDGWHACRVLDVSYAGAGLELLGPPAQVDERLDVELQATHATAVDRSVHALVRHVDPGDGGGLVVGVAFLQPDDSQHALLRLLLAVQSA
jgi:hypothetical protein